MKKEVLRGKIHRATVTQAEVDYEGSIGVDAGLLEAAGIDEYDRVEVGEPRRKPALVFVDGKNAIAEVKAREFQGVSA